MTATPDTTTDTRPARVFTAELIPSGYADESDHWKTPQFTNDVTKMRLRSKHQSNRECTFSIGFVGPDGTARREQGGPVLPGPYAYMFPEATCISASRHPGDAPRHEQMHLGDYVAIRGYLFRIEQRRALHDPELVLVTA